MLQQVFSRGLSFYPRIYLQFAALVGLLIAAEFSLSTLSMMLTSAPCTASRNACATVVKPGARSAVNISTVTVVPEGPTQPRY